jgi:hypothetical protein
MALPGKEAVDEMVATGCSSHVDGSRCRTGRLLKGSAGYASGRLNDQLFPLPRERESHLAAK